MRQLARIASWRELLPDQYGFRRKIESVFSEIISIGGKNWEIGRKKDIGEGSGEKKKHSTPSPPHEWHDVKWSVPDNITNVAYNHQITDLNILTIQPHS